ncbi:TetR/AcrR family transcriptional regulator [Nocardia sp. CA-084685]|uniref:TetR/AcrR family transcriptional regulator n=1 Tax=Nocardia sp. CA-084685 TaxID=3239970 RepID=UPI003D9703BF
MPETRRRLTRTAQRRHTHQRLLTAATTLFLENGYRATSVDGIAEAAGYTRGAAQRHFGTKAQLADAVLDPLSRHAIAQVATQLAQLRSAEQVTEGEQLIELVTEWCETAIIERPAWKQLELDMIAERPHDCEAELWRAARLALLRTTAHDYLATTSTATSADLTVHLDTITTGLVSVVFGLVIQNKEPATVTATVRPLVQHLLRRNIPAHSRTGQN